MKKDGYLCLTLQKKKSNWSVIFANRRRSKYYILCWCMWCQYLEILLALPGVNKVVRVGVSDTTECNVLITGKEIYCTQHTLMIYYILMPDVEK